MICLLAIAWTREIVTGVGSLFGAEADSKAIQIACQGWAILLVYVLDFAINVSKCTEIPNATTSRTQVTHTY